MILQSEFLTQHIRRLGVFCIALDGKDVVNDTDIDPVLIHSGQVRDHNQGIFILKDIHGRYYVNTVIPGCRDFFPALSGLPAFSVECHFVKLSPKKFLR
jgi:hypothetical protein